MSGKSNWLPPGYELPTGGDDNFTRLQPGANRLRILSQPLVYKKGWLENPGGSQTAVRVPLEDINGMPAEAKDVKHCWALTVFNVDVCAVQVWEVSQVAILRALTDLARDPAWGPPTNYGIVVTKTGRGLESRYSVTPRPQQPLSPQILKAQLASPIRLAALLEPDGDPFAVLQAPPIAADGAAPGPAGPMDQAGDDLPF